MTRETKIGLLVGLAFIVVFAVLLLHTGTVPPPGESLVVEIAQNSRPNAQVLNNEFSGDISKPEPVAVNTLNPNLPVLDNPLDPNEAPVENLVSNTTGGDADLPRPKMFDPPRAGLSDIADASKPRSEVPEMPVTIVGMHRTAPQAEPAKPEPSVRPVEVVASASPDGSNKLGGVPETMLALNNATSDKDKPAREYVVQSRDSLYRIAEKFYKSGSPRFINMIVEANKLKNANTVVEGQKLMIPELPEDMFEGAKQFKTSVAGGKPRSLSLDELVQDLDSSKTGRANASRKTMAAGGEVGSGTVKYAGGFEKVSPMVESVSDSATLDLTSLDKPGAKAGKAVAADKTAKDSSNSKSKDGRTAPVKEDKNSGKGTSKESKPSKEKKEIGGSSAKMLASGKSKGSRKDDRDDDMSGWHLVKPNDTMATIAKDNLGSSERWKEIQKLNGDVDPQKMKPGTRIKLPRTKPVSVGSVKGRISA